MLHPFWTYAEGFAAVVFPAGFAVAVQFTLGVWAITSGIDSIHGVPYPP
jgi:hypothetical protein